MYKKFRRQNSSRGVPVLGAALGLVGCLGTATAASRDPALSPCRVEGLKHEAQCGIVHRALDPAHPEGPQIDVHYLVIPALARGKLPDPVFMLAGGPGQSAIALAPPMSALLARLNNRRDLVFVDQRGTGRSAPLQCADDRHLPIGESADPELQLQRLQTCQAALRKLPHGDLRYYTTTIAMQDLDAVRAQLAAPQLNLVGASYGTRAGIEYLRQFPARVRRLILDGVAPPDMALTQSMATDAQAAFSAVLTACASEPSCAQRYPTLRADWAAAIKSLPRRLTLAHPLTGEPETFTLTADMVRTLIRGPLYAPVLASALPQAINEAAQGRFAGLVGLSSLLGDRRNLQLAMGMHFSVICAEDLPRAALSTDIEGPDFGSQLSALYQKVCAQWPRGEVPAAFYQIDVSPAPVLLLSGGADPVTPPRHAERVAKSLGAKALQVVVPQAGHGVLSIGCMRDVLFRFIDAADDRSALSVDASCVKNIPRPAAFQPVTMAAKELP